MPGAPYYAGAFSPLPGRCFRMASRGSEGGGPNHCPEPPTWQGSFRARNGRRHSVERSGGFRARLRSAAGTALAGAVVRSGGP